MQGTTQNFRDIFASGDQPARYRVELMEHSGFNFPEDIATAATASSTKNTYRGSGVADEHFGADNLSDGQAGEPFRYAVFDLGVWKLDGGFRLLGPDAKYTPGWWSEIRSGESGNFASPPHVELTYSPPVVANRIRVSTTAAYPGLSKINVQVRYAPGGPWDDRGDHLFGDDNRVIVALPFAQAMAISGIRVTALATKAPNDYARLTEIEPVLEWSIATKGTIEDYCEDVHLRKSSCELSTYSPAGPGFGINELSFSLSRSCPVEPAENQLIVLHAGFASELLQQGVFIVSEVVAGVDAWNVTAHGVLSLANYHRYPDAVHRGINSSMLIGSMLEWIGFAVGEVVYDLASDDYWEWYVVDSSTCDNVLRETAEKLGVAIYEREDGRIVVRSNTSASVLTITDDLIGDASSVNPQEINYVVVHYGDIVRGADSEVLSARAALDASEEKTMVFGLSKTPAIEFGLPTITAFRDEGNNDLTLPTVTAWSADAYSLTVTVRNNVATAGTFSLYLDGVPLDRQADEAIYEAIDKSSVRRRGVRDYETSIYTRSAAKAKAHGDRLLKYLKGCAGALSLTLNRPAPHLQLRDTVRVNSALLEINREYIIAEIMMDADDTELTLLPRGAL